LINFQGFIPMTSMSTVPTHEPILQTLAPLLSSLTTQLKHLLETPRAYSIDIVQRATLEGIVTDLDRKAKDLSRDEPLLVVMLMGGTGVGKSTLLNALAGEIIAPSSVLRPTTRDPVVYIHESVATERLDQALRACRIQRHRRDSLRQKVIVDTPDLDSTDLANRETLKAVLPIADIVLYVGSQEKYHDRLGWDLFRQERRLRAFAFILNKWDRCVQTGAAGLRPDEDLLRDLQKEGFQKPLLFRVSAVRWVETTNGQPSVPLPEGEQFQELARWLETGLSQLEIEAVKARGVQQLLDHLEKQLQQILPPDLSLPAKRVTESWSTVLRQEAEHDTEILLNTLEPSQIDIERYFMRQTHQHFKGLLLWYFKLYHGIQDLGGSLTRWLPFLPKAAERRVVGASWDVGTLTRGCIRVARERALDQRFRALGNRLLWEAEKNGFPMSLLNDRLQQAGVLDWDLRLQEAVGEAFHTTERSCLQPEGIQRWQQKALIWLGNTLPVVTFFGGYLLIMYRFYLRDISPVALDLFAPVFFSLLALVILHGFMNWLLPINWRTIRGAFQHQLSDRLRQTLEQVYNKIPEETAERVLAERREIEELLKQTAKVRQWLAEREQTARITALYGSVNN
jgi:GTPase Era involved in 16S rRNA processing